MRIVFMGTAAFAVPCLKSLLLAGHDVAAVFTQPDRAKGRGQHLTAGPVKLLAEEYGVSVHQPIKIKEAENIATLKDLEPEIIVVVAYGQILPENILQLPPYGCINVHGSLLPRYRGAAPIQRAIMNGEAVSGVTTMFMDRGLDTGDMILKKEAAISADITLGEYYGLLAEQGAILLLDTLEQITWGTAPRIPQQEDEATYAPPLTRADEQINFYRSAVEIKNQVRALAPNPGATAVLNGIPLKVYAVEVMNGESMGEPGEVLFCNRQHGLVVQTGQGQLQLKELQRPGKKRVSAVDYICGSGDLQGSCFASLPATSA